MSGVDHSESSTRQCHVPPQAGHGPLVASSRPVLCNVRSTGQRRHKELWTSSVNRSPSRLFVYGRFGHGAPVLLDGRYAGEDHTHGPAIGLIRAGVSDDQSLAQIETLASLGDIFAEVGLDSFGDFESDEA